MAMTDFFDFVTGNQVISSLALVLAAVAIRIAAERVLRNRENIPTDQRRRILSNLRNGLLLALLVGIVLIWAPALRTFALSLTAFVIAFILATKELILCVSGYVVKTASGSMRVGSWIEVAGLRGEVTDQTMMSTTIQELGKEGQAYEFTGRTVVIPNSVFLTAPVINERFYRYYVFHTFHMVLDSAIDPEPVETALIDAVESAMADHMEVARRYNAQVEKRAGIDIHDPEPRTRLSYMNDGRIKLAVTAFLPTRRAVEIEQQALRAGVKAAQEQVKGGAREAGREG